MGCSIIEGLDNIPPQLHGCVLTIGNFDGVHRGHQQILSAAVDRARQEGIKACVLTFDPPPAVVLSDKSCHERIIPEHIKHRLIADIGLDAIVVVRTTREFLSHSPEQFVRDVMVERFHLKYLVEGRNFFFGKDRAGNIQTLQDLASQFSFDVIIVEPVMINLPGEGEVRISSSLIRRLIGRGDFSSAARCLGRDFVLYGKVIPGHGRGRELSFPTANVDPNGMVVPPQGVYAAWSEIDGVRYRSAVSVGPRPTFGIEQDVIEVHLIGAEGVFYGKEIAIIFHERLRDLQKFPDADTLRRQIEQDVKRVCEILQ